MGWFRVAIKGEKMNCWEILGIAPTENRKEIKRAYAALAKQYHPEEDEAAFLRVHKAYKQAMAYAERNTALYKTGEKSPDEMWHLQEMEGRENPPERDLTPAVHTGGIDYARVIEAGLQSDGQKQDKLMTEIDSIYYGAKKQRSDKSVWQALFASVEFKEQQQEYAFTRMYLKYLMQHRDVPASVWKGVFCPMLSDWQHYWSGFPELQSGFKSLLAPVKNPWAKQHAAAAAVFFFILLLFVYLMPQLKTGFVPAASPRSQIDIPYSYNIQDDTFQNSNPRLKRIALLYSITNQRAYEDGIALLSAWLDEAAYNELAALYAAEGEEALNQEIEKLFPDNDAGGAASGTS